MSMKMNPVPVPPGKQLGTLQGQPIIQGDRPLRTGGLIIPPETKENLKKLGWKEGDPLPPDLASRVQAAQRRVLQERDDFRWEDNPPEGYKPVKQKFVDINTLPEAEQAELRAYLEEYKQIMAVEDAKAQQRAEMEAKIPDSVKGEMRTATLQAMELQAQSEAAAYVSASVVDDRQSPPPPQMAPNSAKQRQTPSPPQTAANSANQHQTAPHPAAEDLASLSGVAEVTPRICPRCLYDVTVPFDAEVTDNDKTTYRASVLGGLPFRKEYSLFGGHGKVRLRGLLTKETRVVDNQLAWHIGHGHIASDGLYYLFQKEYRLVLMVEHLEVGGQVLYTAVSLDDVARSFPQSFDPLSTAQGDNPLPPTTLPKMREWFYEDVLKTEALRGAIGTIYRDFESVVSQLSVMAGQDDFWMGIAPRA